MRRFVMSYLVLLMALLVPGGVAAQQDHTFAAVLTGEEEVPPIATEMSGSVRIRFNDDFTTAASQESTGPSSCSSPVSTPQGGMSTANGLITPCLPTPTS